MNLIERLGGYERAKDGLHRLKLEKKDLLTCGDLVVVESEIDAALLQYRRQHNIFEVGDKVVYIEPSRTDSVHTIKSMITGDHLRHPVALMGGIYGCGVIMLRHATDAEIAAGKRFDSLKEMT